MKRTNALILVVSLLLVSLSFGSLAQQLAPRDYRPRAGRVLAYTSADGVVHPNSFWALNALNVSIGERAMRVEFIGYHDVASHNSHKQPMQGAVQAYTISGDAFDSTINAYPELVQGIIQATWGIALNTKEGPPPSADQPDTRQSFFAGSTAAQ